MPSPRRCILASRTRFGPSSCLAKVSTTPPVDEPTLYQPKHLGDSTLPTEMRRQDTLSGGRRKMQQQVLRQWGPVGKPVDCGHPVLVELRLSILVP